MTRGACICNCHQSSAICVRVFAILVRTSWRKKQARGAHTHTHTTAVAPLARCTCRQQRSPSCKFNTARRELYLLLLQIFVALFRLLVACKVDIIAVWGAASKCRWRFIASTCRSLALVLLSSRCAHAAFSITLVLCCFCPPELICHSIVYCL